MNARLAATNIISQILNNKGSLSSINEIATKVDEKDINLFYEITFGTARFAIYLEYFLDKLLSKKLPSKDNDLKALLLVALYQLIFTRVAEHAAIFESVEITKKIHKKFAKGLVNAVLRRFLREKEALLNEKLPAYIQLSYPKWLFDKLQNQYDNYQAIMEYQNRKPNATLRVNLNKISLVDLQKEMGVLGVKGEKGEFAISALQLETNINPQNFSLFQEGKFSVQNEVAQIASEILDIQTNDVVLDCCSAPGGKAAHLLEINKNIDLTCLEIDKERIERIVENFKRLDFLDKISLEEKLNHKFGGYRESKQTLKIDIQNADASQFTTNKKFNKIIADVPCSGTGVIRKHPDIKLNRKQSDIENLVATQKAILENVWQFLEVGGILLYCTCSILAEENTQQIERFLKNHQNAELLNISLFDEKFINDYLLKQEFGYQILPHHNLDGFFYALLKKV